jgi:hypothetical protein
MLRISVVVQDVMQLALQVHCHFGQDWINYSEQFAWMASKRSLR